MDPCHFSSLERAWFRETCRACEVTGVIYVFRFLLLRHLPETAFAFFFSLSLFLWDPVRLPGIQHIAIRVPDLDNDLTSQRVRSV